MNSNQDSQNTENFAEEIEADNSLSIDDFIKELEEKEKKLNLFSELVIEVDESDVDDESVPEFLKNVPSAENNRATLPVFADEKVLDESKTSKLENEISVLQNRISEMEIQRGEIIEISRRRQIDFDNFKNRTERERSETFRKQLGNLAEQILPVLDNLNRALDSAIQLSDGDLKDFQQFFDGIFLVNQQLNEVLAGMGVQPISSIGELFDPHFHEAVATEENENLPPHTVTAELLRGYRIDDKVIRPAMVKVSKI